MFDSLKEWWKGLTEKTQIWLRGLFAAFIASSANGVSLVIVSPETFNPFHGGLTKLAIVCFVSGIVGVSMYIKKSPVPK
jgi:hypothetical protein